MAKKFVRGVTGVEDIEKLDKSLTNVNDIISDGKDTYVHTKKGKVESYYNLTDSIKDVVSTDNKLKITKQDNTVYIDNIGLATKDELTTKQDILKTDDGLSIVNNKISINPTTTSSLPVKNGFYYGSFLPDGASYASISLKSGGNTFVQLAFRNSIGSSAKIVAKYRFVVNNEPLEWQEMLIDNQTIMQFIAQKQNTITNNASIGVTGTGLQQLYANKQTYSHANGILKTHVKSVSSNTSVTTAEDEFNFIVKINKGATSATFTLNANDQTKLTKIINTYGQNGSVSISGCIFTLSGSSLTVTTTNNIDNNYVITFSDII